MTSKQCKAYLHKNVKVKRYADSWHAVMIGNWVIGDYTNRSLAIDEVKRIRQAILETIMVDLILDKETKNK
jgi:hypothetical protein